MAHFFPPYNKFHVKSHIFSLIYELIQNNKFSDSSQIQKQ